MTKHRKSRRSKKNILSRGISSVTSASRKVIPGVASGIGNVGQSVIGTAKRSIPKAQGTIRGFFGMFGVKSKGRKRRTRRTRRKR